MGPKKTKILTFDESPEGVQLHAGILRGMGKRTSMNSVWHSGDHKIYWCGSWGDRTYKELYKECQSIIADLEKNHPDLVKE